MQSRSSELKQAVEHEQARLKKITQENEDLAILIDDLARKISKWYSRMQLVIYQVLQIYIHSEKGVEQDEKNLRRMNNQISNTEMMMNQMLDEASKVQTINSAIRDKLQEERERVSQIEDALRVCILLPNLTVITLLYEFVANIGSSEKTMP